MSIRTQAGTSPTVKKTRAPAAKKEAPKTTRTVKKPLAPAKPPPPQGQPSQAPQRKPSPAIASEDDMDKLTAGMKKIKINLITKKQKEERAKTAQSAQANAVTPPAVEQANPTAPSPVAPPVVTPPQDEAFATPPTQPPVFDNPSPPPPPPAPAAPAGRSEVSTPVTEQTSVAVTPDPLGAPCQFASHVAGGNNALRLRRIRQLPTRGPGPVSVAPQEPLTWLPPNTNTPIKTSPSRPTPAKLSPAKPSPAKKSPARMMRADLPVFSSTSAIPFAPQGLDGTPEVKQERAVKADPTKREKSIWEIPETPQK
ncbi:histone deacetylase [Colletotrichum higginsianum]|nr:histone deacetylase [Colletotrichum higginsianum]